MSDVKKPGTFYGWNVVAAAFVLAVFGWGVGFYGPPVFLSAVRASRGWSLTLVSLAVTTHFLFGAIVVANLPKFYRRFGVPPVTKTGVVLLGTGIVGWAIAQEPWQLFIATLLSGAGWVTMSAAAVNVIVSPWFVRSRPAAIAMAYNGASLGGVIFSPLFATSIVLVGFPLTTVMVSGVMICVVWMLAEWMFSKTPQQMGLAADGDAYDAPPVSTHAPAFSPLPGALLWRNIRFITLAASMALGLFSQIGLTAHLFTLLTPALGVQAAGFAMGGATVAALAGRTLVGWLMPAHADRRLIASASYVSQIAGSVAFIFADGTNIPMLLTGIVLFGLGIGNATSMPPLIAQVEFAKNDVPRVVSLIVAIGQATYAFAPAVFGLIREVTATATTVAGSAPYMFAFAGGVQLFAIAALLIGRSRQKLAAA